MPGARERPSDERMERLQQEVVRLRDELARSETDRARIERERARLERENARLKDELEAARRAGARQAAPFSKGARSGVRAGPAGSLARSMGAKAGARFRRSCMSRIANSPRPCISPVWDIS